LQSWGEPVLKCIGAAERDFDADCKTQLVAVMHKYDYHPENCPEQRLSMLLWDRGKLLGKQCLNDDVRAPMYPVQN